MLGCFLSGGKCGGESRPLKRLGAVEHIKRGNPYFVKLGAVGDVWATSLC